MFNPLKSVLVQYKTLIIKMSQDSPLIVQVKLNFDLSYDIHKLLTLFFILSFLEFINALIKFSQRKDVFILDLVTNVKIFQRVKAW
jgi:hypothetical protein